MSVKSSTSLRPGLLSHRLDDQLLVYDKLDDKIHLLDGTPAAVFEMLQQGVEVHAIAANLDSRQTVLPGAELLALALDDLDKARLLVGDSTKATPVNEGRRQVLQKVAGAAAALLLPAIVTLSPSRAYAQASKFGLGANCTSSTQCLSGCCASNSSGGCVNNTCNDPNICSNCSP